MRIRFAIVLTASFLAGCASARPEPAANGSFAEPLATDEAAGEEPEKDDEDEGHGLLVTLLLYLPNRVIDLFDVVRFGVDVGPGIGLHLQATDALQAKAISSASVGVGLQTLRHLPVHVGTRSGVGAGPIEVSAEAWDWHLSPGDFRVEFYVLLVGAHVAVEPFEIVDALAGFLFFDPQDDDL